MRVNFKHYTVIGSYCRVRHFSKTFDSLSQVAKFIDDNRMDKPDKHGRVKAIYLSNSSGLTKQELKILNNKYRALYNRRFAKNGSV